MILALSNQHTQSSPDLEDENTTFRLPPSMSLSSVTKGTPNRPGEWPSCGCRRKASGEPMLHMVLTTSDVRVGEWPSCGCRRWASGEPIQTGRKTQTLNNHIIWSSAHCDFLSGLSDTLWRGRELYLHGRFPMSAEQPLKWLSRVLPCTVSFYRSTKLTEHSGTLFHRIHQLTIYRLFLQSSQYSDDIIMTNTST